MTERLKAQFFYLEWMDEGSSQRRFAAGLLLVTGEPVDRWGHDHHDCIIPSLEV